MVSRVQPNLFDARYYEGVVDHIADQIVAMSVGGYSGDSSDNWKRARSLRAERSTEHLEFAVILDRIEVFERSQAVHGGSVVYFHRFVPDDLGVSQGRLVASARHLAETLLDVGAGNFRILTVGPIEFLPIDAGPEWVRVTVDFTLYLPRG